MDCLFEEKCCHFKSREEAQYEKDIAEVKKIDHKNHVRKANLAFGNKDTEYYELQQEFGPLNKGAIFYWDENDDIRGSIAAGCLKLAWTYKGDCQCGHGGDSFIFHAELRKDTSLFKLAEWPEDLDAWEEKAKAWNRQVYRKEYEERIYQKVRKEKEECGE